MILKWKGCEFVDIIKKDGRLQKFDKNKIFVSLENASRDVEEVILNGSDIKILVEDICNRLDNIREDGTPSSSYEIIGVIIDVLKEDGFTSVVKAFLEYE